LVGDLLGGARTGAPALTVTRGVVARPLALVELGRPYVVGRGATSALALDVEEVSREHAAFVRDATGVVVRDLGSKNGVLVRGARVEGERRLADGDIVEIGPVALTLDDPIDRYLQELAQAPEPPAAALPSPPAWRRPPSSRLPAAIAVAVLVLVAVAAVLLAVG